jgi:hypothetical protein
LLIIVTNNAIDLALPTMLTIRFIVPGRNWASITGSCHLIIPKMQREIAEVDMYDNWRGVSDSCTILWRTERRLLFLLSNGRVSQKTALEVVL